MDYELAAGVTSGQYYYLQEQGKGDKLKRGPHPLMSVIKRHMK